MTEQRQKNDTITVIGGGTMGRGIAITALVHTAGRLCLVETAAELRDPIAREIEAEASTRGARDARSRLSVVGEIGATAPAALIVEAVPEHPELKRRVLREAEQHLGEGGVLATNTSSLSIESLAGALEQPGRFLGMHFFQPVPDTVLTELILHPGVDDATVAAAERWTTELGRESISARDVPGFATSRLGLAIGLEAIRMLEEGVASAEDIDRGMRLGYQHAVGPLRMTDLVGLDVRLAIAEYLTARLGPRFEPPALLREMVAAGRLGKKSGRGFFDWPSHPGSV